MSEWIIRPYRGGDGAAINRSFNRVFGCHRSDEEWEWKFLDRPLGPFIMVAVGPEGEVLAQYAAVPVRLQTPVGVVWAGQVVDVFSLPSVRQGLAAGKAYLQAMALFFARWGNPDHLALLFGFPSQRPLKLGQLLSLIHI
ncbi:MAG: GNAT family N-acetyltransferase, partial [Thermoanaerobaculum sp.]|nr:GNAT family N-acetyltransferase [Thermoanaerobaculum sp.]